MKRHKITIYEVVFLTIICLLGLIYFYIPGQENRYDNGVKFLKFIKQLIIN